MSTDSSLSQPFFQIGVLVQDIHGAMVELTRALGLTWTEPLTRANGESELIIAFSHQGPPRIELIQGPAGSVWDASDGSRIDHIGYWAPDLGLAATTLEEAGMDLELDGRKIGGSFTYHRGVASGLRVETLAASYSPLFHERFGLASGTEASPP